MIDFTSARFLGGRGVRASAPPNLGKPSALIEPPGAEELARYVARTRRAESGMVARSTLHALCDILASAAGSTVVLIDEHCYPITPLAVRAAGLGGRMLYHRHRDAEHVGGLLAGLGHPATVVADAWCGGCLRPASVRVLIEAVSAHDGELVLDDSLAFGALGVGRGLAGVQHERLLWLASAGKSFGTPLALVAGTAARMDRVKDRGPNRMHSSPASTGDIAALTAELTAPDLEARTARLAALTRQLRHGLSDRGVDSLGGPLPVVGVPLPPGHGARVVAALTARGVAALPVRSRCLRTDVLTFCVRADHTPADVAAAVRSVGDLLARAA